MDQNRIRELLGNEIEKAAAPDLKALGFRKKRRQWHRYSNDVLETIVLLGSQWEPQFYVRAGRKGPYLEGVRTRPCRLAGSEAGEPGVCRWETEGESGFERTGVPQTRVRSALTPNRTVNPMRDPDFMAPWAPVHDLVEKLPECDPTLELKSVLKRYKLEQLRSIGHTVRLLEHVTGLQGILIALVWNTERIR